jgi:hypothetical protein
VKALIVWISSRHDCPVSEFISSDSGDDDDSSGSFYGDDTRVFSDEDAAGSYRLCDENDDFDYHADDQHGHHE